jgi:DNA-binding MarR family transcriptional regulator
MVQATKAVRPRPQPPRHELVDLAEGLRDVMLIARRKTSGSAHDKSVVMLLSHLMSMGPLRASDLSERACLDLSTVSRHLRTLEEDGYVTRTPDPDDRRAQLLTVTPSGEDLVATVRAQRLDMLAQALDGWSDADRSELIRLTRQLANSLETL